MAITVPSGDRTGAYQLQSQIATVAARSDPQSQQQTKALQESLVHSLLDQQRITAADILATVSYSAAKVPADLSSELTKYQSIAAGTGMPAQAAALTVDQIQRQIVQTLFANGGMTAAAVLASSLAYKGGARP